MINMGRRGWIVCIVYILLVFLMYNRVHAITLEDMLKQEGTTVVHYYSGDISNKHRYGHAFGGFSMRWPAPPNIQFFEVTPPSISVGCSGIDINWGAFSMLKGEELINKLKGIIKNGWPYALKIALTTACPQCAHVLDSVEAAASMLNSLNINGCKAMEAAGKFLGKGLEKLGADKFDNLVGKFNEYSSKPVKWLEKTLGDSNDKSALIGRKVDANTRFFSLVEMALNPPNGDTENSGTDEEKDEMVARYFVGDLVAVISDDNSTRPQYRYIPAFCYEGSDSDMVCKHNKSDIESVFEKLFSNLPENMFKKLINNEVQNVGDFMDKCKKELNGTFYEVEVDYKKVDVSEITPGNNDKPIFCKIVLGSFCAYLADANNGTKQICDTSDAKDAVRLVAGLTRGGISPQIHELLVLYRAVYGEVPIENLEPWANAVAKLAMATYLDGLISKMATELIHHLEEVKVRAMSSQLANSPGTLVPVEEIQKFKENVKQAAREVRDKKKEAMDEFSKQIDTIKNKIIIFQEQIKALKKELANRM